MINKIIKLISGREIDSNIPLAYVLRLAFTKVCCLIWGGVRLRKLVFLHPTTIVKCSSHIFFHGRCNIERNCYIDAVSEEGIILGRDVSIGRNTTIQVSGTIQHLGKGIKIGNNVGLGTDGYFGGAGGLEIGNDTIFGNYVSCHPENHNYSDPDIPIRLQGVNHQGIKIGSNCWIGAKTTILDGAEIGNGCIVAAGAVVRGKFPDNVIIGGVPAKILKERI
jgi:acetyltransferase-like isoleucine patch superfamily enzyme